MPPSDHLPRAVSVIRHALGLGADGTGHDGVPNFGKGRTRVITELCVMQPDEQTKALGVVSLHPGVSRDDVAQATGREVRFADALATTPEPSAEELDILRDLKARTARAHADDT